MIGSVLNDKMTKVSVVSKINETPATLRKYVKRYFSEGESEA